MKPRKKKCKSCGKKFQPWNTLQTSCKSVACALEVGRQEQERQKKRETRERKQKLKTRQDWLKEAQVVFNRYIRLRDEQEPCISCGSPPSGPKNGGSTRDAGHYRTTKACPALRFDERAVHSQCVRCNRYLSGNKEGYIAGLRERLGVEVVEALDSTQPDMKWTIEDAKRIKKEYNLKIKQITDME